MLRDRQITIFDTTLRDGEQTPGVSLTPQQKIDIAYQLDKLGVDIIEAGFPIASEGDRESVRSIAAAGLPSTMVCGLARVLSKDIDTCIDVGVDMVHTFVSTSDIQRIHTIKKSREEVLDMAVNAVDQIKDSGIKCMFSAMDATRTDLDYLIQIFKAVEDAKCDIINVPDTVGVMAPSGMYNLIKNINDEINIPIDTHCHNDFGLAVANSLMAVEAGASQAQVTINGLGERAGNADLAETVMSLQSIYGARTNINTEYIVETARLVERYTGIAIPAHTPVVGENAFAHESGIHTHGVLEKSDTFEPGIMTPEMVGHTRRIVLGKHAGKHAIRKSLESANLEPTDEQLNLIIERVKEIADKGKKMTDADLYAIAFAVMGKPQGKPVIDLKEVSVMTGNITTPTAVVKAIVDGEERVASDVGIGPVDAALNAVYEISGKHTGIKIHDFRIEAVTGGSDAVAEVIIGVQDERGRMVTARAANADIVLASVEALVTSINMLLQT
ncbi:2-isopropylmalate synthase [Methanohalophilus levihalophilus]|uniref:2-isopropylmalate synthase n=1 Tax=Methanohalophilus levihalophilus TaxID=1431282 RepID=UPI001AE263C7|nr:2-isopropylmalate synthase [Methanohalophilus levihalophilus]MBP2029821.1 2-isopropylmalate synthase [Methanohalophilus levihalophilus]